MKKNGKPEAKPAQPAAFAMYSGGQTWFEGAPDKDAQLALEALQAAVDKLGEAGLGAVLLVHWSDGKGSVLAAVGKHAPDDELHHLIHGAPGIVSDWAHRSHDSLMAQKAMRERAH